jgi:archaeosine-15-forming tRNA-guanine transglycosylase
VDSFDYKVSAILGFAFDDAMTRPLGEMRAVIDATGQGGGFRGVIKRGEARGFWREQDGSLILTRKGADARKLCREAWMREMTADPAKLARVIERMKGGGK